LRALGASLSALLIALAPIPFAVAKPAEPEVHHKMDFVCPVGGKAFSQGTGYDAFPLITFPDGSWLGDTEIGVQIPVCPENGLVLIPDIAKIEESGSDELRYSEYSAAERERLPTLIADPAYQALKADGPYAQAYWLASLLGRPGEDRFFMLQRSTWATRDPALRKRLVARLAADGMALIGTYKGPVATRRFHASYVANALRELGRFDEAAALLEVIEKGGPPVLQPQDPESIFGPEAFAPELRLAIAEKDDGRFPAEMLPRRMLSDICDEKLTVLYGPTGASTKAACKVRREREARETKDSEEASAESQKWDQTPTERDKACAATPEDKRSKGLAQACDNAQNDRDRMAGDGLTRDGAKLAADCEATPDDQQRGPLSYGCISYKVAVESALGTMFSDDDEAYRIICGNDGEAYVADRSSSATLACSSAAHERLDRASNKLLEDPVKLDALCAATKGGESVNGKLDLPLSSACFRRKLDLESAKKARHSPEQPKQISSPETAADRAIAAVVAVDPSLKGNDSDASDRYDMFDENSSLSKAARARAAIIIAEAKRLNTYPKRKEGDRF
jgi:hypothetical protein